MTEKRKDERDEGLTEDQLEEQEGKELPDREVMTILPIDPTAPSKIPFPPVPPVEPTE